MFLLGHLGVGSKLASPWSRGLSRKALLLGTVLPDVFDKPLYYGLVFLTGQRGAQLGMMAGPRLFGHTALFLGVLSFLAFFRRSKLLAAIALGVATHLLLDNVYDSFAPVGPRSAFIALVWPWFGLQFPVIPAPTLRAHLEGFFQPPVMIGEVLGALLLVWDQWKLSNRKAILEGARSLRRRRVELRRWFRRGRRPRRSG
jgi:hypothetical protein